MFSVPPCQQNRCMIRETLGDGEHPLAAIIAPWNPRAK